VGIIDSTDRAIYRNIDGHEWVVEDRQFEISLDKQDWSSYRTLKILMHSQKRTGTRVRIEITGPDKRVLGWTIFSVDWQGENHMQLWLDNFEPYKKEKDFCGVEGIKMSCEIPGSWPAGIIVKDICVTEEAPVWKVNESDTLIEAGYHKIAAKPDEWIVADERSFIPAAPPFCLFPTEMLSREGGYEVWTFETFGYGQGDKPGKLSVSRRFDVDISRHSKLLLKMTWDRDALLTVKALTDGEKVKDILVKERYSNEPWQGEWYTFGCSIEDDVKLDSIELMIEETETRNIDGRNIAMRLFWIIIREDTFLDEAPIKEVDIKVSQDRYMRRRVQQVPFADPAPSETPIGDPMAEGLPYGFIFNKKNLPVIKQKISMGAEAGKISNEIIKEADEAIASEYVDKSYYPNKAYGGGIGQKKGLRGAGMRLYAPVTAAAHLLTGEERYAKAARRWILRAAASDDWRGDHGGCVARPQIGDRGSRWDSFTGWYPMGFAGEKNHCFHIADSSYGIVLAYDMLYHCFCDEEKKTVEDAFGSLGVYMLYDKLHYFREFYINMNQGVLFALPLLMQLGFIKDRDPVYQSMYEWTLGFLLEFGEKPWSGEGVCLEGPGYGQGTLREYIEALPAIAACRGTGIKDIVTKGMLNVMEYIMHVRSTVYDTKPLFISLSDGSGKWGNTSIFSFFAHEYDDPYARYFFEESHEDDMQTAFWSLLYADPKIRPQIPQLPPAKVFRDQPMVFFRTGWQKGDTLAAMTNIRKVTGHGHMDRGSIVFEYNGEQLLIDPGMVGYSDANTGMFQATFCHNTLTFNQASQLGGTEVYDTSITDFLSHSGWTCPGTDGTIDWAVADITAVYPQADVFFRHMIFLRPNILLLFDEVRTSIPNMPELNFNCKGPLSSDGKKVVSTASENQLLLFTSATSPLEREFKKWGTHEPGVDSYRLIVRSKDRCRDICFLTILAAGRKTQSLPEINCSVQGSRFFAEIENNGYLETVKACSEKEVYIEVERKKNGRKTDSMIFKEGRLLSRDIL